MELEEFILDYVDPDENDEQSVLTVSQKGRGRPRIQEKWTRVVNVDTTDSEQFRTFQIGSDLLLAAGLPMNSASWNQGIWEPIFCPRKFVKENSQLTMEGYELDQQELLELGRQVTQLRAQFRIKAAASVPHAAADCAVIEVDQVSMLGRSSDVFQEEQEDHQPSRNQQPG